VLTDASSWNDEIAPCAKLAWQNDVYKLWRLCLPRDEAAILCIAPAIGHQRIDGAESFAIGAQPVVVYAASGRASIAEVELDCHPNPGCADHGWCTVDVATNAGYRARVGLKKGDNSFSIPLCMGLNRIELSIADPPRPGTALSDVQLNLAYMKSVRLSTEATKTACLPVGQKSKHSP